MSPQIVNSSNERWMVECRPYPGLWLYWVLLAGALTNAISRSCPYFWSMSESLALVCDILFLVQILCYTLQHRFFPQKQLSPKSLGRQTLLLYRNWSWCWFFFWWVRERARAKTSEPCDWVLQDSVCRSVCCVLADTTHSLHKLGLGFIQTWIPHTKHQSVTRNVSVSLDLASLLFLFLLLQTRLLNNNLNTECNQIVLKKSGRRR